MACSVLVNSPGCSQSPMPRPPPYRLVSGPAEILLIPRSSWPPEPASPQYPLWLTPRCPPRSHDPYDQEMQVDSSRVASRHRDPADTHAPSHPIRISLP